MQIRSRLLLRAAIVFLGVILCLGLIFSYGLNEREAKGLSGTEWDTVRAVLNSFVSTQYQDDAVNGESGYTIESATLKGQTDSDGDNAYLDEGDDAANAPVLVDVLNGAAGGIIQTTAVLGTWNTTSLTSSVVTNVASKVDEHEAAGFSTDVVVYCLTGHTEAAAAGGYAAVSYAGGLGGSTPPRVLALKWGRYGWNSGSHAYSKTNSLAAPTASPGFSAATNTTACNGVTPDAELVRCTAEWALSAAGGNVGNGTTAGDGTGYDTNAVIDIRPGAVGSSSVGVSGSTYQVPINTLFNTGLTNVNPAGAKNLFANRTQHTAGMMATGMEMLGYDSTFASWGLAEYNNTIGEQYPGGMGYGLVSPATIDTTPPSVTSTAVENVTSGSADIHRIAAEPATMKIEYGTTMGGPYTTTVNNTVLNADKTVGLSSLAPSTTYYVKVTSYDGQANGTVSSELSFTTAAPPCTPAKPSLSMATAGAAYWASYADYMAGELSLDLSLTNNGANGASAVTISGASILPATVSLINTPYNVGAIAAGMSGNVTVKFSVPMGVSGFVASMSGSATDDCDGTSYPMP